MGHRYGICGQHTCHSSRPELKMSIFDKMKPLHIHAWSGTSIAAYKSKLRKRLRYASICRLKYSMQVLYARTARRHPLLKRYGARLCILLRKPSSSRTKQPQRLVMIKVSTLTLQRKSNIFSLYARTCRSFKAMTRRSMNYNIKRITCMF